MAKYLFRSITVAAVLVALAGCESAPSSGTAGSSGALAAARTNTEPLTLREADVIKVSFPGATNLDTTQAIRRDGLVSLPLVGEVRAAGKTPADLQAELAKLYSTQLVSKEVQVTVVSSTFPTFVTGAVLKPGKIASDHPLTVLEAIMEAGGFDAAKADLRAVKVIRQAQGGKTENYTVNVKRMLEGNMADPFYLKPSDIVYVPERFVLF